MKSKSNKLKKHAGISFWWRVVVGICSIIVVMLLFAWRVFGDATPSALRYMFNELFLPSRREVVHGNLLPCGNRLLGIDVSSHQRKIDWDNCYIGIDSSGLMTNDSSDVKLRKCVDFAMIKATEGASYRDYLFKRNFDEVFRVGIIRGAYHFFRSKSSARNQAENFIDLVDLNVGDLPPILDVEEIAPLSSKQLRDSVMVMLNILERHYDVTPIIYASSSFYYKYFNTEEFRRYPFWIAHYNVDKPNAPRFWHFWQFTDSGAVVGIQSLVDVNCFVGTRSGLERMLISDE